MTYLRAFLIERSPASQWHSKQRLRSIASLDPLGSQSHGLELGLLSMNTHDGAEDETQDRRGL